MNISEYKKLILEKNFIEYPDFNTGKELISAHVNFSEADLELKTYVCKLILSRSFYGTYTAWYDDVKWIIHGFFKEYNGDHIKPYLSDAIKEAAEMILSDEAFTKGIIATSFMFGVLEFYAKYKLGFRPQQFDFFDKRKNQYIKDINPKPRGNDITIKSAFQCLQKQNLPISNDLNEIDSFTISRLEERGIQEGRFLSFKIADRLNLPRNTMLHGESHSFYQIGPYLLMLYMLFYLHDCASQ